MPSYGLDVVVADFNNDSLPDIYMSNDTDPSYLFWNKGNGTFEDATEEIGLHQKIFNTQGICLVDLNNRGVLDMIFANEGQESCVLLGNPERVAGKRSPVTLDLGGYRMGSHNEVLVGRALRVVS